MVGLFCVLETFFIVVSRSNRFFQKPHILCCVKYLTTTYCGNLYSFSQCQGWFYILKFRSMTVNSEHTGSGVYSDDTDPRVTRMGRILRKHSLDELPQLINIFKGDMSFIGPRPPLTYHPWPIEQYTKKQRKMFSVRPGITGWAQVNGRKTIDWNERIRYSNWYIDHLSFTLDCKIVWMTVKAVLKNDNNANIGITAPPSPQD